MNINELSVSNVVGELVKNSIDAQCNVVQVEFNGSFDFRVIDDGCGFDENTMQDVGERQLYVSPALQQKHRFRYGKYGKFLLKIAHGTVAEIFIESIRHNTDVRLYKSIVASKSLYKVYQSDRSYKDASVTTAQGSMVVLSTLNLSIDDGTRIKSSIVNTVVDLSLINFEVDISVKDTATQQTLFASQRTKNLFDKFEQFLESRQFFSKIQSVSCEKHDVKVELFLCEDATSTTIFQFVYFNKLIEHDGKCRKFINKLCEKRFENDLNSKCPVYLLNIFVENHQENQLAYNLVIDNCIRKCVEQLTQSSTDKSSVIQQTVSRGAVLNPGMTTSSKDPPEENRAEVRGVGLGDYIFNNSCENYEQLNLGREVYRKKICENWIISLDKPKPKDLANDSLQSVAINRRTSVQKDDHLFKKPKPKQKRKDQKIVSILKPAPPHTSSQIYRPSQQVKAFDNSSLLRASKKLIAKTSNGTEKAKRKNSTKNRDVKRFESIGPTLTGDHEKLLKKSSKNVSLIPMNPVDMTPDASFESLNGQQNEINHELKEAFKAPIYYKSTQKTLDFRWNKQTTNFNMNFSSSIAIHTMNEDPFMDFLGNDVCDNNSLTNFFESSQSPAIDLPSRTQQTDTNRSRTQMRVETNRRGTQIQTETNRPSGSSVYSQKSEIRSYRHHQNNSIQTHYRQQTFHNFVGDKSINSNRSGISSGGENRNTRPNSIKSVENSTHTATAVAPLRRPSSSVDLLSDNVLKTGWPVTININFGQPQ